MEDQLRRKVREVSKDSTGVLLVDDFGLTIESSGALDQSQAALVSSIMRNVSNLSAILHPE
jgi:hypothetical protein